METLEAKEEMKSKGIPLFWCLSARSQALLMQYNWDNFGIRLEIPPLPEEPEPIIPTPVDMTLAEIGEFMSQAPSRSRD